MAYLGFHSIEDVEDMGIAEYQLRMEAYNLKRVSEERDIALQAFLNQSVQATKGSAKHPVPKYKKFSQFFDYDKFVDDVRGQYEPDYQPTSKASAEKRRMDLITKRWREYQKLKKKKGGKASGTVDER